MEMKQIGIIKTGFCEKFGIPRQAGLAPDALGRIVFEKEYRDPAAFKGIEGFSHLWLIWDFSLSHEERFSPTVRPPRLGGKERLGVFATRSPFRPNPLGLSCVRLLSVDFESEDSPALIVGGVDMLDKTPIYDIKPYIPYADAHPKAQGGFTASLPKYGLTVRFDDEVCRKLPPETKAAIRDILAQDPRTAYLHDDKRIWGLSYDGWNIRFRVEGSVCTVVEAVFHPAVP
ncbi:MAG: tRNA (N6-threonylcarbamoyladenosine(37)-N6)-methyltransferase TrmO [Lachnospiraceae bacterium]|nr:tRNA (N6-threonylcarbamoyladenosine(37)-N6)-methyltransferase TrmO [Lachnospiraceae bacterium]